jgi:flagellar L-ring protein precursor FlgH
MRHVRSATMMAMTMALLALAAPAAEEVDNPYGEETLIALPRASKKHDRVTVVIDLQAEAAHESSTETTKETSLVWEFTDLFRIDKDQDGDFVFEQFEEGAQPNLDLETEREHTGEGETDSREELRDRFSAEVVDVRPNGHLVIEARRSVTYNNETRTVLFTGRVDPKTLQADNSVMMDYIIEPVVTLSGKGDVSDAIRRGWLSRLFDTISPF